MFRGLGVFRCLEFLTKCLGCSRRLYLDPTRSFAKPTPPASDEDGELDRRLNAVELTLLGVLGRATVGVGF